MKANEMFKIISKWELNQKIKFLEDFLYQMVITNRALWSDNELNDKEKLSCLKWSNELVHRIWNVKSELERENKTDISKSILEHIKFYIEQEQILKGHLGATLKLTFEKSNPTNP